MALARVAASAKKTNGSASTITFPVATRPTVGNGLIVFVNTFGTPGLNVPTDNNSNAYSLALTRLTSSARTTVFYCPKLTATAAGATFDVTVTTVSGTLFWVAQTVEVSGVGPGLAIDQSVSQVGISTAPATSATAALGAADTFQVAIHAASVANASITVAASSPTWTQEFEELPFSFISGEAVSRVNSSSAGTTPSASWTNTGSGPWSAALVAFKASVSAAVESVQSYVWMPV